MPVIKSSDYRARGSFICLFFFSNPQDILEKKSSFKEQLYLLKNVNLYDKYGTSDFFFFDHYWYQMWFDLHVLLIRSLSTLKAGNAVKQVDHLLYVWKVVSSTPGNSWLIFFFYNDSNCLFT